VRALYVLVILVLAFIDGRYMLKGRKTSEIFTYWGIIALTLFLTIMHLVYFQPFIIADVITMIIGPIMKPLLTFLLKH